MTTFTLVIHGGAGTILKENSTPEQLEAYRKALKSALHAGYQVLVNGGEAMDAATAAVCVMEGCIDCLEAEKSLINSRLSPVQCWQRGCINIEGKNELEASIMLSKPPSSHPEISATRRGFGLTLLTRVKNPAKLARALYLSPATSSHALLSGANAEVIAESLGEKLVDPSYFFTERRWRQHRRGLGLPEEPFPGGEQALDGPIGTVGAVTLDVRGCIASVTSTGGRNNKLGGRIGDTPLFGAGFWAEEWAEGNGNSCAVGVSGTGDGDTGDGMYRGLVREDGVVKTAIFADDILT